jgi:hypothetical protein
MIVLINSTLGQRGLSERQLEKVFEVWWPRLEMVLQGLPKTVPQSKPRTDSDKLSEVLGLLREQNRRTLRVRSNSNPPTLADDEIKSVVPPDIFHGLGARRTTLDFAFERLDSVFEEMQQVDHPTLLHAAALLQCAIEHGIRFYNSGSPITCAYLYCRAAKLVLELLAYDKEGDGTKSVVAAVKEDIRSVLVSVDAITSTNADRTSWQLRGAFDRTLEKASDEG